MERDPMRLNLTLDQINAILAALGQRPFVEVADLIAEIRKQAQAQLAEQQEQDNGSDQA